ncbi:hypothetical protein [Oceanobacillus chungangensis]|uniref:Uncharacterized protein n=1 Tax=Oceanobacillus chungangensis TaxID=1229152 RepID=A0A3D8PQC1_9BACI|nr:hypothetical protein [Oceanobacillus chungangensis]RDW17235.1 hypothetical protein CWR45_12630 [Oceanobacillus chungangensis]
MTKGYRKFKISFHLIIFVFAIGLILSSIVGFNEVDRALLYLILGILFALESSFGLYKSLNKKHIY